MTQEFIQFIIIVIDYLSWFTFCNKIRIECNSGRKLRIVLGYSIEDNIVGVVFYLFDSVFLQFTERIKVFLLFEPWAWVRQTVVLNKKIGGVV